MTEYVRIVTAEVQKVAKVVEYTDCFVAELDDGQEIPINSYGCKPKYAIKGNYFIQPETGLGFFADEEELQRLGYRQVQVWGSDQPQVG